MQFANTCTHNKKSLILHILAINISSIFIIHVPALWLYLSVCHFVPLQAIIKEQLQETNGMCEYAIYVQGEASLSRVHAKGG